MKLLLIGHEDRYAVEQLQLALFPLEPMEPMTAEFEGDGAVSRLIREGDSLIARTTVSIGGVTRTAVVEMPACDETVSDRRQILQQSYYKAALPFLKKAPAWGALSGVRPTKLTTRCLKAGLSDEETIRHMERVYFVTPRRAKLSLDCSKATMEAAAKLSKDDVSLYVGIPFCPTRCAYCSFVSRTIGKRTELMEPYLEALHKELRRTGELMATSGKTVRTIYIGGGTPTTLTSAQMEALLKCIRESFDLSRCIEFTVEGGRPDTLDQEKLHVIAQGGADRMSINPQTMIDSVLRACGRRHSAADVETAYRQAVEAGYSAINMDLIAGLPTDDFDGFKHSLDTVIGLDPANITVHTLAIKKGADLYEKREGLSPDDEVARMVDYAEDTLRAAGYEPYYLYRQKYMSGSFENVGWCKPGTACLYNIYMMEELHTIISVGGGGMNKVNLPDATLKRFHNPKFPEQYIDMIEDVLRQKEELFNLM
ncbi:MAG: coproporphyrinogen dehydrogenase HemZ [Oscillospiraceae bacterium]|nr:coproporphyrinogen dehydrogenase HemZ [Oscillospiraceae bacterium]